MPSSPASNPGRLVVLVSHVQLKATPSHLAQEVQSVLATYDGEARIEVVDRTLDEALDYARELERANAVDVFVCAGATGAYLRRNLSAPVVLNAFTTRARGTIACSRSAPDSPFGPTSSASPGPSGFVASITTTRSSAPS